VKYDRQGFATAEDGTRLFYGVLGSGPAFVLNDGIGCDGFVWKYLQPELAKRYRVIHWHFRGHGRSGLPRDPGRLDIAALARDLASVLDEVGTSEAIIAGHSMGTQVSLEFFRLFPHRVSALVLMNGSYGRVTETFHGTDVLKNVLPSIIEAMQQRKTMARARWGRVPSGLAFRVARLSGEVDRLAIKEEDFRLYWDHINLMAPDVFLPMLRLAGDHSAEDLLEHIDVPTLVIAAERDTFTPREFAKTMAERIPDAEYLLLAGASHAAPVEQPQAILRRIDRFVADRLSTRHGTAAGQ
jgi:pimeloyl-ACP methyl ester carboxylesterase